MHINAQASVTSMLSTDSELARTTIRKVTRRLLPFLLLLYIVSWLDRANVSFAALQMNIDLGFNAAVYGFGAGIFFIGYGLFEIPSNLVMVRVGPRLWIARIMVTWGLLSAGMMCVAGERSFYVMRFLLGVAEAGFLPGILYYLSQWFPATERARAVSWFMMAIPLSIVIGGPLSGLLLEINGTLGLKGWQWMYLVEGLPAVVLGFVVLGYLTDQPQQARWLTLEQRAWLDNRMREEHLRVQEKHRVSLAQALLHPTVWKLALIMFTCQTGSYGLTLWVPQIVKGWSKLGDLQIGMISALPYAAAAAGMVLIGISSDRRNERFLHIAIPSAIGALGFVASAYLHSPVAGLLALTVAAVGDYGTRGPFWALPGRFLAGGAAAAGIALINTMGALGGFIGPYLVGYLKNLTGSFESGLLLLALVLLVGAFGTLRLRGAPILAGN